MIKGIITRPTAPDTPASNGLAESTVKLGSQTRWPCHSLSRRAASQPLGLCVPLYMLPSWSSHKPQTGTFAGNHWQATFAKSRADLRMSCLRQGSETRSWTRRRTKSHRPDHRHDGSGRLFVLSRFAAHAIGEQCVDRYREDIRANVKRFCGQIPILRR